MVYLEPERSFINYALKRGMTAQRVLGSRLKAKIAERSLLLGVAVDGDGGTDRGLADSGVPACAWRSTRARCRHRES